MILLANWVLAASVSADSYNALHLYQKDITRQIKTAQLLSDQKHQVIISSSNSCDDCSEEVMDAEGQPESNSKDLKGYMEYIKSLYGCEQNNDLTNDCTFEFQGIKSSDGDDSGPEIPDENSYCD